VNNRLAGKVAFVTGGGGGIGEATVRLFWEEGARVAVVDNDLDAAQAAARNVDPSGERVLAVGADLTQEAEAERAVQETVKRFGRLDILVNVAGVRVWGPITEATPESWDFILGVNLLAVAYCCKYAIPEMDRIGGGSIVTMTYMGSERVIPNYNVMGVAKAALECSVRYLANDLGPKGIRVNAISAGPQRTLAARAIAGFPDMEKHVAARAPMRRNVEGQDLGSAGLYLCSDLGRNVTGEVLHVDGGYNIIGM